MNPKRKKSRGQTIVEYFGILAVLSYWVMLSLPFIADQMTTMTNEVTVAMEMAAGGSPPPSGGGPEPSGGGNNGNGVGGSGNNRSGGGDGTNPGGGGNDSGTNNPNRSGR